MNPPRIVSREEWGARYSAGAGPAPLPAREGVALHHSTDPERNGPAAIRALEAVGQARFGAGISYTFIITVDGTIYEGHGIDRRGAHTAGHNSTIRAICLHGNYMDHPPSDAQLESAAQLMAYGVTAGWWPSTRLRGHRDFKATACPGDKAYPLIPSIVARADAIPTNPTPEPEGWLMALTDEQQTELYEWTKDTHAKVTDLHNDYAVSVEGGGKHPVTGKVMKDGSKRWQLGKTFLWVKALADHLLPKKG